MRTSLTRFLARYRRTMHWIMMVAVCWRRRVTIRCFFRPKEPRNKACILRQWAKSQLQHEAVSQSQLSPQIPPPKCGMEYGPDRSQSGLT